MILISSYIVSNNIEDVSKILLILERVSMQIFRVDICWVVIYNKQNYYEINFEVDSTFTCFQASERFHLLFIIFQLIISHIFN